MRPSPREIARKIGTARGFLAASRWAPAEPFKLAPDLHRLALFTAHEQTAALLDSLRELAPSDYIGKRPPEKSYEQRVYGREMFAFRWDSIRFGRLMYLKFCVTTDTLYILSLHESRRRI